MTDWESLPYSEKADHRPICSNLEIEYFVDSIFTTKLFLVFVEALSHCSLAVCLLVGCHRIVIFISSMEFAAFKYALGLTLTKLHLSRIVGISPFSLSNTRTMSFWDTSC